LATCRINEWKQLGGIDAQMNNTSLTGRYYGSIFKCPKTDFYSYFLLTQIGKSSRGNYYFELTYIELFGETLNL
jgi:hypothetical protein